MSPNRAADPPRGQLALLAGRPDAPLPEVFRLVCEAAADALRVDRVGIWLLVNDDRALRCVSLFERAAQRHSKGNCLVLAEFPSFRRAISSAPLLPCASARTDPRTAELSDAYFAPHRIASVLGAPVRRDGRMVGLLLNEQVGPAREWSDDDRDFALSVACLVADRMKAAEGVLRTEPRCVPVPAPHIVSDASHELRNVFTEILAHAELLTQTAQLAQGAAARVAGIASAAERGVALVRRLFEPGPAADPGTGEYEPLPPRPDPRKPQSSAKDDGTDEHQCLSPVETG